ncbi:McbB family protein [Pseudomonas sp. RGM2987]|uniref:McbB family protein n=1 Tax=Pseudomonas sp. RGM2987 TaxID=2930090 RepID=UPI001FD6FF62|nr:McbB family protein [Pseudomonas sp. RGM2987]MCJ8203762.1 McbB family protein [Pseudomonas sp. RGM2987]
MKLSISNYELLNFETSNAVVSEKGIARVDSPAMLKLLKELKSVECITKSDLNELFANHNLEPTNAYDFLSSAIRINTAKDLNYFESTLIVNNWGETSNLENILSREIENLSICSLEDLNLYTPHKKERYIIILCSNYNYADIKKLYFSIAKKWPKSAISVCYGSADLFHISQPYIPEIGNPCHFCTIDKLISNETHSPSVNTWSKLLNFCKGKNINLPRTKPTLLQESLILGAVARVSRLVSGTTTAQKYQDNIFQTTTINLGNGHISQASATHWHLCDCLGAEK